MRIYPCRRSRQRGDWDDSKLAASPCHPADYETEGMVSQNQEAMDQLSVLCDWARSRRTIAHAFTGSIPVGRARVAWRLFQQHHQSLGKGGFAVEAKPDRWRGA